MDGDGGSGMRNYWPFYKGNDSHLRQDINLRQDIERDNTKHFFPGYFHHPECSTPQPQSPMDLPPSSWMTPRGETKFLNYVLPASHNHHANYGVMSPNPVASHIMQPPDPPPEDEKPLLPKEEGKKKRSQAQPTKPPKPKKPKKAAVPKDEPTESSASQENMGKSSSRLVINGIDLDISRIPTPVCSCTGTGQQCYKWGIGGWQSACCTTNTSQYPLPMSTKRRGARIAGRKMSQGAFKKVLERLAGEGYNLSNPIDLKQYWAKHGTNKFVTIR